MSVSWLSTPAYIEHGKVTGIGVQVCAIDMTDITQEDRGTTRQLVGRVVKLGTIRYWVEPSSKCCTLHPDVNVASGQSECRGGEPSSPTFTVTYSEGTVLSIIEGAFTGSGRPGTGEPDDSLRPHIRYICTVTNSITGQRYLYVSLNPRNMLCDGLCCEAYAYYD